MTFFPIIILVIYIAVLFLPILVHGLAEAPFVILSSLIFGYLFFQFYPNLTAGGNFIGIVVVGLLRHCGQWVAVLFGFFILLVAPATIIHSMVGIFALCAKKIYPYHANAQANERQRIKYGKLLTGLIALFCGLIPISLENISLLTIDIFSGIFFSAPAGVLLCGFLGKKEYGNLAVYVFLPGMSLGFGVWLWMEIDTLNWFCGTLVSFFVPIVFLQVAALLTKRGGFNQASLNSYK